MSYLEEKWKHLLKTIQVYITCEGRYSRVMIYHFKLMNHFTGRTPLNFPYYLHRSLTKMAYQVQAKPNQMQGRLFHHGLIKLIILEELQRRNKTWRFLLLWGEFLIEPEPKDKKSSTPKSSKRKRRALSPAQVEDPGSSSKLQKVKKKLDFEQAMEDSDCAPKRNVLNLPYSDSESETMETPTIEAPAIDVHDLQTPIVEDIGF
jgi:hypothetical protein